MSAPATTRAPRVNWTGLRTLLRKEIRRFTKVWLQTVLSPLATTSLYFLVFGVALGKRLATIDGVPYIEFVVPGLMMLAMINASFLNSASSLFQSKINGTTVDFLVAPLGPAELLVGYVGAAVLRAAIVGVLVWAVAVAFVGLEIRSLAYTIGFALAVSAAFATLGLIVAIWAEKFDHLAIVPNFVLTPLTFLGGVFYSIDMLPEPWQTISRFNPILYMVNGLRDGLLGVSDVPLGASLAAVLGMLVALLAVAWRVLSTGWNLRS
ncbi:MAG: ABC transporter permease [Myxococcota bacterium]